MDPITMDLLLTVFLSLLVLACGLGAILVLPWSETGMVATKAPAPGATAAVRGCFPQNAATEAAIRASITP